MKYVVYWEPDIPPDADVVVQFLCDERAAIDLVIMLIAQQAERSDFLKQNISWNITLLKVVGEVRQLPRNGPYVLQEPK